MARADIRFEFAEKPASGTLLEVVDGIRWLRMPLPFALNHINLWLIPEGENFALVDTGLCDDESRGIWEQLFADELAGAQLSRLYVTHMHPDHVGCAGYLAERFGIDLWMPREEYLLCRVLVADTGRRAPAEGVAFYRAAGYSDEDLDRYQRRFGFFGRYVSELPESYVRLRDGQQIAIGEQTWEVIVGRGHSPEHACLYCAERRVIIGGDQLLPSISANVSVHPTEPGANPLDEWMESLAAIRTRIAADTLVLPAHGKPYRGVHARIDDLLAEHRSRLEAVKGACRQPQRVVDVFPALYRRPITEDNLMFATGEAIAHLNYLLANDELTVTRDGDGIDWYRSLRPTAK